MTGHHTPWDSRKPSQTHPNNVDYIIHIYLDNVDCTDLTYNVVSLRDSDTVAGKDSTADSPAIAVVDVNDSNAFVLS